MFQDFVIRNFGCLGLKWFWSAQLTFALAVAGGLIQANGQARAHVCCLLRADDTRVAKKATLGAETRVPNADEAQAYQLSKWVGKTQGQCVSGLDKGGSAEKAGLKVGDVLVALDANKVFSRDDIEDFLRVSRPGSSVKVLVKRALSHEQETVTVTLGTGRIEDRDKHFTWQYAGLGQLDAALAAAQKEDKWVLVGLSGADT
jgi:membrane-associated protease RseP (regulator of RpoE activity)